MHPTTKRMFLYGAAVAVLGGLGYAVATVDRSADAMTLLSSARTQLGLAYAIPAVDKQGKELPARDAMITEAIAALAQVESQSPGMACTAELRGFGHMLRTEYSEAAACYARAQVCKDVEAEQRDVLAFNQARMLAKAGRGEAALAVFRDHAKALDARFGQQRAIEEAGILRGLGRTDEAVAVVEQAIATAGAGPVVWLQAGMELAQLGLDARAEAVFEHIVSAVPIADYHIGRLKLKAGAVDIALDCLERAAKAAPAEVRRLVHDEPDAWRALAQNARFEQIATPTATPGR